MCSIAYTACFLLRNIGINLISNDMTSQQWNRLCKKNKAKSYRASPTTCRLETMTMALKTPLYNRLQSSVCTSQSKRNIVLLHAAN